MSKNSQYEEKETTLDEVLQQEAELEATADKVASGNLNQKAEKLTGEEKEEKKEDRYTVYFDKEYTFETGEETKKYETLDLSGLTELTTTDGEIFDRVLVRLGHRPVNKFNDTTYCKHVAMKVTGLPVEFFDKLSIRDMQKVVAVVYYFFLFG